MNILVIDVGTSSMRGILYDEKAAKLKIHQVQYDVIYSENEYAEQNPADWKNALYEIVRIIAEYAKEKKLAIDGLALTSQRSSVIPVTKEGEPLRNAIMWLDKRNSGICKELEPEQELVVNKTGARINAVFSGSKMTWIKRNEPEIYERAYKILTIADYLAYLMTGEFRTDHTYGSRSSLMNVRTRSWDDGLLELFQIDREKLCDLIAPGDIHGVTTESFARATGIQMGIPLISAGGDQQCAALGQGVLEEGAMELTTGTGAFALAYASCVPQGLKSDVICGAHAVRDAYVLETSMLACSSLYDWFRRNFFSEEEAKQYEKINREIAAVPAGARDCVALPYFQGRGTPDWNNGIAGVFANITLKTTRSDMARALLESIAYEACNNLEVLEHYIGEIRQIFIGGGLTNFQEFNQMQADIYQKSLIRYDSGEETSLGALISAGVTLKAYSDYKSAFQAVKGQDASRTYEPNPENGPVYQKQRQKMNEIYRRLKS